MKTYEDWGGQMITLGYDGTTSIASGIGDAGSKTISSTVEGDGG